MTEVDKEREAIVAWLRDLAIDCPPIIDKFVSGAADAIERLAHHKGKDHAG